MALAWKRGKIERDAIRAGVWVKKLLVTDKNRVELVQKMEAVFSPCGQYRYRLDRAIDFRGGSHIAFCLHNPSTADANVDDQTTRRTVGFAAAWGASRLTLVNPWAGRATKPRDLWKMADPLGSENDAHLAAVAGEIAKGGGFIVMAFGRVSPPANLRDVVSQRLNHVEAIFRNAGCDLRALGANLDGSPKHPLYVRAGIISRPWRTVLHTRNETIGGLSA